MTTIQGTLTTEQSAAAIYAALTDLAIRTVSYDLLDKARPSLSLPMAVLLETLLAERSIQLTFEFANQVNTNMNLPADFNWYIEIWAETPNQYLASTIDYRPQLLADRQGELTQAKMREEAPLIEKELSELRDKLTVLFGIGTDPKSPWSLVQVNRVGYDDADRKGLSVQIYVFPKKALAS